jgi:photosystem II stability/assembly factor-like uncharacterized protein
VYESVVWGAQWVNDTSRHPSRAILRSTDDGLSWEDVSSNFPNGKNNAVMSFAFDGSVVYVGTSRKGVMKSTNNGLSWDTTSMRFSASDVSALVFSKPYLFVSNDAGIFRSSDGGDSWTYVGRGCPSACYSLVVYDTMIFAGASNSPYFPATGGVYKLNLHDTAWTYVGTGLDTNDGVRSIYLNGSDLYAGTLSTGVWKRPLAEVSVKKDKPFFLSPQIGNNYPNST